MSDPRRDLSKHSDQTASSDLTRRTLLKRGLLAGGTLAGAGLLVSELTGGGSSRHPSAPAKVRSRVPAPLAQAPNILVVLVDQLRSNPRFISKDPIDGAQMPNLARLSREGVSFASHYTASNDCTPARSTLLTGLYTHQTGCMITGGSTLDPGFPTWGSMLREHGYETYWYGKWHLTHHDNRWDAATDGEALEPYGFSGGTYPSPDGAPGQGWRVDPYIASQFQSWFEQASERQPWCTTVSFVNPHDIAWWYRWSDRFAAERPIGFSSRPLPVNFETPEQLLERGKPRLQRSLQETAAQSFGAVPFDGPQAPSVWGAMMDLYTRLRSEVDGHIGRVLETLASRPSVAANTIVVFTSDHGEYGGAHGMRGKGAGAYEEAIRVPLIVKDPRGKLARAPQIVREQLSSSVDVAPLLLSIATGSEAWRGESRYAHLADRLDIASILSDPSARGRSHVLHATDEIVTEFASELYARDAPLHVVALRTHKAKLATYSNWGEGGIQQLLAGQESELYDYRGAGGRLELENLAGSSREEDALRGRLESLIKDELRAPLPQHLRAAGERGFQDYLNTAVHAVRSATAARARQHGSELEKVTTELALNTKHRTRAVNARLRGKRRRHHRAHRHRQRPRHRRRQHRHGSGAS